MNSELRLDCEAKAKEKWKEGMDRCSRGADFTYAPQGQLAIQSRISFANVQCTTLLPS